MKFLTPTAHGVVDYLVVLAFLAAPSLFNFTDNAATVAYVIAAAHLSYSLITRYPLGIVKAIPFPIHGTIELAAALSLFALPWVFDFSGDEAARNWFIGSGAAIVVVWLVTNYKAVAEDSRFGLPGHLSQPRMPHV
ncbi:MAG: hypothetical protein H0W72_15675 [Planctomycetes bacterium]|nr:hypothetical protein [Planctomycetota bacterium]